MRRIDHAFFWTNVFRNSLDSWPSGGFNLPLPAGFDSLAYVLLLGSGAGGAVFLTS